MRNTVPRVFVCYCLCIFPLSGQPSPTARRQPLVAAPSQGNAPPVDHRVILQPGRWKIRAPESTNAYLTYHFFLGSNWTAFEVDYPGCSQLACRGLADRHRGGCDLLCSTGTWRDATVTLNTATLEYNRAMASLEATFNDLAALMDTHVKRLGISSPGDSVSELLAYHGTVFKGSGVVDVMRHHRTLIEEALNNAKSPVLSAHTERASSYNDTSDLLDTWKSGAFKLAVQLNAVTFAFQGAQQRLLSCAQGVQRADMTGCEPGFNTEFYIDTPVASRSLSSGRLAMTAKRERWYPVALSHWYMPFMDSSKGNRTCWLNRPMVTDMRDNYRVPQCDYRGVCEPLVLDDETVSACEVNENGEIRFDCPVACGTPCFGAVCYQPQSDTYELRTGVRGNHALNATVGAPRPRVLSKVYSLSDFDTDNVRLVANIRNYSKRAYKLMRRGQATLRDIVAMEVIARNYIAKVYADKTARSEGNGKCVDCEHMIGRSRFMAAASVILSALTCPLLIVVIVKLRSENQHALRSVSP